MYNCIDKLGLFMVDYFIIQQVMTHAIVPVSAYLLCIMLVLIRISNKHWCDRGASHSWDICQMYCTTLVSPHRDFLYVSYAERLFHRETHLTGNCTISLRNNAYNILEACLLRCQTHLELS